MTLDFARTIGDDYAGYTDDELGYNYHAYEVISASEASRLQRIQLADSDELTELAQRLDDPTDLDRWALARRYLATNRRSLYFEHLRALIDGNLAHPALHYPEIFVDLARRHAEDDRLEKAQNAVDGIEENWPELTEALPLLRAQLLVYAGQPTKAHEAFEQTLEEQPEDIDLLIETAEDFADAGEAQLAHRWLGRARSVAAKDGDDVSLVDIDLLEQRLSDRPSSSTEAPSAEDGGETSTDGSPADSGEPH